MTSRLLRSALYVPAANPRALAKAPFLGADVVIYDLEDSVAPEAKVDARSALATDSFAPVSVIRVNGASTEWHDDDVIAGVARAPRAMLLPKAGGPEDIWAFRRLIALRKPKTPIAIWAMIETPAGVLAARAIAEALGPDGTLVLGLNDLARDTGIAQVPGRAPMQAVLTQAVLAARAHGAAVLDGVFNAIHDDDGFRLECAQARAFGFDGKTVVHPGQIGPANAAFRPTLDEIAAADAIIAAFAKPEHAGRGVIALGSRMVERLHLDMAVGLRARADAISATETTP